MKLTGPEYSLIEQALRDAFVDYDDLGSALRRSGRRINDITQPATMPQVVSRVIEFAETRDWIHELLTAARAANPSNVALFKVAAAIGLEPGGMPLDSVAAGDALLTVGARLERMVDPKRGIADLGSFAARLQELLRQVCAVELGDEFGTGFLIGPRTVLTNYHVVERAATASFPPAEVVLRFDYQRLRDRRTTNAGVTFRLADDWLVDAEPYSPVDKKAYDPSRLPQDHELDYAVLRTQDPVGTSIGPASVERGWVVPRGSTYGFPTGSFLMVVQHPCNDPISFDYEDDAVVRVNPNVTRVHYRTNTMPGSSGSPVLDRHLELVALHHSGEPGSPDFMLPCHKQVSQAAYNEGIPIARIQQHLASKGRDWVFGSDEA